MLYYLSKIFWFCVQPSGLLLILLVGGVVLVVDVVLVDVVVVDIIYLKYRVDTDKKVLWVIYPKREFPYSNGSVGDEGDYPEHPPSSYGCVCC